MIYASYRSSAVKQNIAAVAFYLFICLLFSSCGPYTFKDVSIPPEVKTIKVSFIENRASYKNPQLSSRITDQLQQKISSLTRRSLVTSDNADYQISGYISSYNVTTAAISSQQASVGGPRGSEGPLPPAAPFDGLSPLRRKGKGGEAPSFTAAFFD